MKKTILALSAITLLSGCATFKNDEFSCGNGGVLSRGLCISAQDAYEAAEKGKTNMDFHALDHVATRSKKASKHRAHPIDDVSTGVAPQLADTAPVVGAMRTPISQPKPLLMPATVLEAWVNAYEDDRGNLHLPSSVFVEVTPRRWSLEATNIESYSTSGPFQVIKAAKPVNTSPQSAQ